MASRRVRIAYLEDDGEEEVDDEEGTDDDDEHEERDRDGGEGVLQSVHYLSPSVEGDALQQRYERDTDVVERLQTVHRIVVKVRTRGPLSWQLPLAVLAATLHVAKEAGVKAGLPAALPPGAAATDAPSALERTSRASAVSSCRGAAARATATFQAPPVGGAIGRAPAVMHPLRRSRGEHLACRADGAQQGTGSRRAWQGRHGGAGGHHGGCHRPTWRTFAPCGKRRMHKGVTAVQRSPSVRRRHTSQQCRAVAGEAKGAIDCGGVAAERSQSPFSDGVRRRLHKPRQGASVVEAALEEFEADNAKHQEYECAEREDVAQLGKGSHDGGDEHGHAGDPLQRAQRPQRPHRSDD